jgi:hypothetical protein
MNAMPRPVLRISLTAAVLFALAPLAHGGTLYVANNGLDGPSCGPKASPCRSISQAIALAAAGDTTIVGPGSYSAFTGETPAPGCGCMLAVNKAVILLSRDGPAATVIDAGTVDVSQNVLIITDGGEFGRAGPRWTPKTGQ